MRTLYTPNEMHAVYMRAVGVVCDGIRAVPENARLTTMVHIRAPSINGVHLRRTAMHHIKEWLDFRLMALRHGNEIEATPGFQLL